MRRPRTCCFPSVAETSARSICASARMIRTSARTGAASASSINASSAWSLRGASRPPSSTNHRKKRFLTIPRQAAKSSVRRAHFRFGRSTRRPSCSAVPMDGSARAACPMCLSKKEYAVSGSMSNRRARSYGRLTNSACSKHRPK